MNAPRSKENRTISLGNVNKWSRHCTGRLTTVHVKSTHVTKVLVSCFITSCCYIGCGNRCLLLFTTLSQLCHMLKLPFCSCQPVSTVRCGRPDTHSHKSFPGVILAENLYQKLNFCVVCHIFLVITPSKTGCFHL